MVSARSRTPSVLKNSINLASGLKVDDDDDDALHLETRATRLLVAAARGNQSFTAKGGKLPPLDVKLWLP